MRVRRIVPNLACRDAAAARDFYAALLRLEVAVDLGWIVTLASPANQTAQLSLGQGSSEDGPHLTVEVDDVDSVYAASQERGDEIVYALTDEPWGVRRFFVRDPNGS